MWSPPIGQKAATVYNARNPQAYARLHQALLRAFAQSRDATDFRAMVTLGLVACPSWTACRNGAIPENLG